MTIENRIRKIQRDIIKTKKEKGMQPDFKIVSLLVNIEWCQDKIEAIRDNKK